MSQKRQSQKTVTLWIDSYNDIFSDFDPRPFSDRAISEDFLSQLKKVSRESSQGVSIVKILVPEGNQKEEHERAIRKKLEDYFTSEYIQLRKEVMSMRKKGVNFFVLGLVLMIGSSYISTLGRLEFTYKLMLTLFEPGGWFFFWTGLDIIRSSFSKKGNEIGFYEKLKNVHVEFNPYK